MDNIGNSFSEEDLWDISLSELNKIKADLHSFLHYREPYRQSTGREVSRILNINNFEDVIIDHYDRYALRCFVWRLKKISKKPYADLLDFDIAGVLETLKPVETKLKESFYYLPDSENTMWSGLSYAKTRHLNHRISVLPSE